MEIWKKIEGFETYEVSSTGRIKSLSKKKGRGIGYQTDEQLIDARMTRTKYLSVTLFKKCHGSTRSIHRLVAGAFISNPEGKPHVNHIDGNKTNNRVENLEWCTCSENHKHAFRIGLRKSPKGLTGILNHPGLSKPVIQKGKDGVAIKEWPSAIEVTRQLGYSFKNISSVAKGRRPFANGFIWEFKKK